MFEKFSEDAIRAIMFAREEARRLEFAQVFTEHVLLGIIGERHGPGSKALMQLGIDLKRARVAVEHHCGRGYTATPLEEIAFSSKAQELITSTLAFAQMRGMATVDTAHMILNLIEVAAPPLTDVLMELGITREGVEGGLKEVWSGAALEPDTLPARFSYRHLTPQAANVLERAKAETLRAGHVSVGTEQLLLALVSEGGPLPRLVLEAAGLDEALLRAEVHRLVGRGSGTVPELFAFSHIAERVFDNAWQTMRKYRHKLLGTGHLLLGLLDVDEGTAAHLFQLLDINSEQMRWDLDRVLSSHPEDPEPKIDNLDNTFDDGTFADDGDDVLADSAL